jgi:hypothetical protein
VRFREAFHNSHGRSGSPRHQILHVGKIDSRLFWSQDRCILCDACSPKSLTMTYAFIHSFHPDHIHNICASANKHPIAPRRSYSCGKASTVWEIRNCLLCSVRFSRRLMEIKIMLPGSYLQASVVCIESNDLRFLSYPRTTYLCKHYVRFSLVDPRGLDSRCFIPLTLTFTLTFTTHGQVRFSVIRFGVLVGFMRSRMCPLFP